MLAGIAVGLGVDREDLDFADVTYCQGSEFLIENEFDAGYAQLTSVRSESAGALLSTRLLSVQGDASDLRSRRCLIEYSHS